MQMDNLQTNLLNQRSSQFSGLLISAGRAGAKGEPGSPIDVLAPPINKLTLLKTAVFVGEGGAKRDTGQNGT